MIYHYSQRDGLASRLSQLIRSWQSNVQMWTHQMALAIPQGQRSQPLGNIELKENHLNRLPQERSKKILGSSPALTSWAQKYFHSPAVKNLSVILGTSSLTSTHFSPNHENSKKHLKLKIIRTGGELPSNAAECEEYKDHLSQKTIDVVKKGYEFWKKEKNENGRIFLVIDPNGENKKQKLLVNDTVKVYAPW